MHYPETSEGSDERGLAWLGQHDGRASKGGNAHPGGKPGGDGHIGMVPGPQIGVQTGHCSPVLELIEGRGYQGVPRLFE